MYQWNLSVYLCSIREIARRRWLLGKNFAFFNFYNRFPIVLNPRKATIESFFFLHLSLSNQTLWVFAVRLSFLCQETARKWTLCCLTSRWSTDTPAGIILAHIMGLTNLLLFANITFIFLHFDVCSLCVVCKQLYVHTSQTHMHIRQQY